MTTDASARAPHPAGSPRPVRRERWALAAIVLVALYVRLAGIDAESFWVDEASSWAFARLPLVELWTDMPRYEFHPPLYYTMLKLWMAFVGDTETALRVPSTLAGVLTVVLVFLIGRTALDGRDGTWVGLLAAAVIALHPVQIQYSREVRSYAVLTFAAATTLLALGWWLRHPHALSAPLSLWLTTSQRDARRVSILFVVGTALAFWMHYTSALLLGAVIGVGVVLVLSHPPNRWRTLAHLALLGMAVFVLWLPAAVLLRYSVRHLAGTFWLQPPSFTDLLARSDFLLGSTGAATTVATQVLALAIVGVTAAGGALAIVRRGHWRTALLWCAAAGLPILISFVVSRAATPIFIPRTLVWVEVGGVLLAASATLWLRKGWPRRAGGAALVAIVAGLGLVHEFPKEPWRQIVELLEREARPGDLLVTWNNYVQVPFEYYDAARRVRATRVSLWPGDGEYPTLPQVLSREHFLSSDEALARVREAHAPHGAVWVVTRVGPTDPVVVAINGFLGSERGPPSPRVSFQPQGGLDPPVLVLEYPPPAGQQAQQGPDDALGHPARSAR